MNDPFKDATKKKKYLKLYIYGDSGVGKTHFSLTFPNPVVIDLEGGTDFFSDRFKFRYLDTKSFAEVMDAADFLAKGKHDYQTLIIDPITVVWSALQDGRLEYKAKNIDKAISGEDKADFNFRDWGQLKRFYSSLMTKLTNLPMHIILIAREKDEYEKRGDQLIKTGLKPDCEKSTPYVTDIRFRLALDRDGKNRTAIFEKDRSGHFPRGTTIKNPNYQTFQKLVEAIDNNNALVTHQDETDAVQKDAGFFAKQEKNDNGGKQPQKPAPNQSSKPQDKNENKALEQLRLKAHEIKWQKILYHQWEEYVCTNLKVENMEKLTDNQIKELDANLNWANTEERIKKYEKGILEVLNSATKNPSSNDDFPGPPPYEEVTKIRKEIKSIMSQIYGKNQAVINEQISTMTTDKNHDLEKMNLDTLREVLNCTNILLDDYNEKLKEKRAKAA